MSKKQFKHERTCIVCKNKDSKANLLRFVLEESSKEGSEKLNEIKLVYDTKKCLEGRGAYIHLKESCLSFTNIEKALRRAFRLTNNQRINLDVLNNIKPTL